MVVENAHTSCVNLVKFLDLRTFVTCSDDHTLAVWDIRNLKQRVRSLEGHRNWVKSIEYDSSKGLLLSAAYDQTVLKWDINNCSPSPQTVLNIKNMLRMVLTPDSSKMVLSTADGYIMIIHDLDLNTLAEDLRDFAPDLYRLMQDERNYGIDMGSWLNHLFLAKTNRVELISDFPEIDKNGYITTLNVHPYGWAVLSRNMAGNELSEWTCVHDIQHTQTPLEMKPIKRIRSYFNRHLRHKTSSVPSRSADTSVAQQLHKEHSSSQEESLVFKNRPRLKYFIEELNENHGFIKELCFSPDGRVVCSPHQFGFRLLSFDNQCSEMSDCLSDEPKVLKEVKQCLCHSDYVLTTKFSPTQWQIASGCLKGRVVFTQPIL